jgi:hypothetical protein
METRRTVLQLAALGAASAFIRPAWAGTAAPAVAAGRSISVAGLIDVARALAEGSLASSLFWYDNNLDGGSRFQGTPRLVSAVPAGAEITWIVDGLEVETYTDIVSLRGPAARLTKASRQSQYDGAVRYWAGRVPEGIKGEFAYEIALNINGKAMAAPFALALAVV